VARTSSRGSINDDGARGRLAAGEQSLGPAQADAGEGDRLRHSADASQALSKRDPRPPLPRADRGEALLGFLAKLAGHQESTANEPVCDVPQDRRLGGHPEPGEHDHHAPRRTGVRRRHQRMGRLVLHPGRPALRRVHVVRRMRALPHPGTAERPAPRRRPAGRGHGGLAAFTMSLPIREHAARRRPARERWSRWARGDRPAAGTCIQRRRGPAARATAFRRAFVTMASSHPCEECHRDDALRSRSDTGTVTAEGRERQRADGRRSGWIPLLNVLPSTIAEAFRRGRCAHPRDRRYPPCRGHRRIRGGRAAPSRPAGVGRDPPALGNRAARATGSRGAAARS